MAVKCDDAKLESGRQTYGSGCPPDVAVMMTDCGVSPEQIRCEWVDILEIVDGMTLANSPDMPPS